MARVLVVDDNEPLRRRVRQVLEQEGHSVQEADEGRKGFNWFEPSIPIS